MSKSDLQGKKFGKLLVDHESGRSKDRSVLWTCLCDCGKWHVTTARALNSGETRSCGCLRSETVRLKMSGENHHKWGGGAFKFGSKSWARRILSNARGMARRRGYEAPDITAEQFVVLAERSGGACGICERVHSKLCLDHCHETGRVRGFLCRQCNSYLGFYGNNPDLFRAAARWLEEGDERRRDAVPAELPRSSAL